MNQTDRHGTLPYGVTLLRICLGVIWSAPVFLTVGSIALWLLGDGAMAARRSDRFVPAL